MWQTPPSAPLAAELRFPWLGGGQVDVLDRVVGVAQNSPGASRRLSGGRDLLDRSAGLGAVHRQGLAGLAASDHEEPNVFGVEVSHHCLDARLWALDRTERGDQPRRRHRGPPP